MTWGKLWSGIALGAGIDMLEFEAVAVAVGTATTDPLLLELLAFSETQRES